jgi:hypothetical protein
MSDPKETALYAALYRAALNEVSEINVKAIRAVLVAGTWFYIGGERAHLVTGIPIDRRGDADPRPACFGSIGEPATLGLCLDFRGARVCEGPFTTRVIIRLDQVQAFEFWDPGPPGWSNALC